MIKRALTDTSQSMAPRTVDQWRQISDERWERLDGAVVKYDHTVASNTARPWLPNHRGFMAYGPGPEEFNALCFTRRNSPFHVRRKFKTARAAMAAVDQAFPPQAVDSEHDGI